jgi:phosphate transport system protein
MTPDPSFPPTKEGAGAPQGLTEAAAPSQSPRLHNASFQQDLERIQSAIERMAGLAERALLDCVTALRERKRQLAYAVIIRDQRIDELEKEVDRLCLEFLVRQQPVAAPLRFVYSTIKVNLELERIGDYSAGIARQVLKLIPIDVPIPTERFLEIARLSLDMLRDAMRAFVSRDALLAQRTALTEAAVDQLKSKLNKDLVRLFQEQKLPFEALNPLMMIARHLERVSDQARNISHETIYVATGEDAKHPDTDLIRVLFVDEHNACRSLMAEAVAGGMSLPCFQFASAGLKPKPVEPATREFMRGKGCDVSRMAAKALSQVPNLDHYRVVVALAGEVRAAFPQAPRDVVLLDWITPDPSRTEGSPAQVNAAYEQTYQFIQEHLRDLVDAILGPDSQPRSP